MANAIRENDPALAPPLDQVFGLLQREYPRSTIETEVRALLKTPRKVETKNHESILKLSTDANGKPFVVTTNFDLMFEKLDSKLQRWSAPLLPSMVFNESPTGIVYLHGRLAHNHDEIGNLILSSGDFGRAYLADGWSTVFMRELLERRVVVLLGYSAGDPPIRYLLEGLSASSSSKLRTIYAFGQGPAENVRAKWSELGIVGIGYDQFSHLWATLEAWANRSSDKNGWVSEVISLARTSPRALHAFQRGQVAALVATPEGAKSFSEAVPKPPAEWICVFDKLSRYGRVEKARPPLRQDDVDPHEDYGLDDDPPRVVAAGPRAIQEGLDLLSTLPTDAIEPVNARLSNVLCREVPLGTRVRHLMQWFVSVLEQPSAVWWAVRQHEFHPAMLAAIRRRLTILDPTASPLDASTKRVWALLYEGLASSGKSTDDFKWVTFQMRVRAEGWTNAVLRELRDLAQPYLAARPVIFNFDRPPVNGEPVDVGQLVRFDVKTHSRRGADIEVPDEFVRPVTQIMRGTLECAITLLDDVQGSHKFYRAPAISPEDKSGSRLNHLSGIDADFLWFVDLCERLRKLSPKSLREEMEAWPNADGYFFARLQLHFWMDRSLFDSLTVGMSIEGFPDEIFWNPYVRRELLHLLRARWSDFSNARRRDVERRILRGRQRYDGESVEEHLASSKYDAGTSLGWLQLNGCVLSGSTEKALGMIRGAEDWSIEHERGADHDWEGQAGWVEQRKDPSELGGLATGQIVSRALELSGRHRNDFVEERPFVGLIEKHPVKAFLALTIERRRRNFPLLLWRQLISAWPPSTSPRLFLMFARRLATLPVETVFELRHEVTRWMEIFAARFHQLAPTEFWLIWDSLFNALGQKTETATASAIVSSRDSEGIPRSTKTVTHAINGPMGHLLNALFNTLADKKFVKGEGFSHDFRRRVRNTLSAPGDGASHAAILLGRRLNFLYFVDARWFKRHVLPHLSTEDALSESFWAGAIAKSDLPYPAEFFKAIKSDFLKILHEPNMYHLDEGADREIAQMLVQATFWNVENPGYVSFVECRDALRSCSESGRHAALWAVEQIVPIQKNWDSFGRRFFQSAWPREVIYRSGFSTECMVRLATNMPARFPEVVQVIHEYLTFVDYPDTLVFGLLDVQDGTTIAARWPEETLAVLTKTVRLDTSSAPYQLGAILDVLADADKSMRTRKSWRDLAGLLSQ
ncbi:SIR2 family protein [Caballeronia eucalypticola]|uniref:SIR2 family protein n=1 Tax=Caballeronia sp. 15715 TaxID=3391030 RepID=UPI0039E21CB5